MGNYDSDTHTCHYQQKHVHLIAFCSVFRSMLYFRPVALLHDGQKGQLPSGGSRADTMALIKMSESWKPPTT